MAHDEEVDVTGGDALLRQQEKRLIVRHRHVPAKTVQRGREPPAQFRGAPTAAVIRG